jgi:LmbE family N-acetylglucosaminyl deacetylase
MSAVFRLCLPGNSKNTLRQMLVLEFPDRPPEVIEEFSDGPVLVIAPHMDDEIIGGGGTLAMHRQADQHVTVVFTTDGSRGNPDLYQRTDQDKASIQAAERRLVVTRKSESTAACGLLDIHDLVFLDGPDSALEPTHDLIKRLAEIILDREPGVVYIPSMLDSHRDHWATNRIFHQVLKNPDMKRIRMVVRGYEVWTPLIPNRLVYIEDVIGLKKKALEEFKSQLNLFDLAGVTLGLNRYRTLYPFKGTGHAEAFFECSPETWCDLFSRLVDR